MNPPPLTHANAPVVANDAVARATYRLRFRCPPLARAIAPGQFLMLRVPGRTDPLLGRAFALYDTVPDASGEPVDVDIVYAVVGKMTGLMATLCPDQLVEVWGPLGNGFPDYHGTDHLIMVAGGIGQTPFLALGRQGVGAKAYGGRAAERQVNRASLFYGVRTAQLAAGVEDFCRAGIEVRLASDDGSCGFRGFVTDLLDRSLATLPPCSIRLVGCGPEPMMHALADLAQRRGLPCDLSLETPMACGIGVCFSCVTKVACPEGWDYRRVCIEGPVFDASRLIWSQEPSEGCQFPKKS
jgi:dihydroorotate dehydrogenase electron transfer subunit